MSQNILLFSPIAEKITAVKHANNTSIWLLSHDKFTNRYLSFLITNNGVNPTPISYYAGSTDTSYQGGLTAPNSGYLKASQNGTKVACAFEKVNKIDVLNFDNTTGQFSFDFTITNIVNPYGVEFSPNDSLLYATGIDPPTLTQFNLGLSNPSTIISNSVSIDLPAYPFTSSIQRAPDKKIYLSRINNGFLDCIHNPNQIGISCNYAADALNLNGKTTQLGLPNFAPFLFTPLAINAVGNCSGDTVLFSLENAAAFDSVQWNFGDVSSGNLNYSNSLNPTHIYANGGSYFITLIAFSGNQVDTLEHIVNVYQAPNVSFPSDTIFCYTGSLQLDAGVGDAYMWQDGTSIPSYTVYIPGIYYVTASNFCGLSSDTVNVNVSYGSFGVNLGEDLNICEGNQVSFDMLQQTNSTYLWQDGSTNSNFTITQSGEYYVSVSNVCGTTSDTVLAVVNPLPTVFLGEDIFLCNQSSIMLSPSGVASDFIWSDGSTNPTIIVDSSGIFAVSASNSCGTVSDTILVRLGNNSEHTIEVDACEPVMVNGIIYNESGIYTQTLINSSGCDSILTIEAEIQNFNAQIFQTDTTLYFNGNPTNIQWFNCLTGQIIPGENNPVFVPQQTGNYGAIITIGECTDTSNCRLIPVPPLPQIPPDLCENIRVAPNPVSDQVSFVLDKETYAIRLFSQTGALIWQKTGTPEKQIIDFRNYAPALYVLEVDQCRFKIVKQ